MVISDKQLIDVATSAGAVAVEFEVFRADRLCRKNGGIGDYLSIAKPIRDLVAKLEKCTVFKASCLGTCVHLIPKLRNFCCRRLGHQTENWPVEERAYDRQIGFLVLTALNHSNAEDMISAGEKECPRRIAFE